MYARVACGTGWTWEYIGQALTLPRLNALYRHWQKAPPVAESVAAFLGVRTAEPAPAEPPISNADIVRHMKADPRKIKWITERPHG